MDRRTFLRTSAIATGGLAASGLVGSGAIGPLTQAGAAPTNSALGSFAVGRPGRPAITHGVQSGDVTFDQAIVWARADRPSRLVVEVSSRGSFRGAWRVAGQVATPDTDFTAKVRLDRLPAGQRLSYRARFESLDRPGLLSEPVTGTFVTPSRHRDDVRFVWTGDNAGQGWGINPEWGGMRCWETMRRTEPQFMIHNGDSIYADGPLLPEVTLTDGTIWKNIVTPEKAKVAETLDEFRGNFRYNLMDDNVRRFLGDVSVIAQWDDHEVVNNWYPGEILDRADYTVKDVDTLARRSAQAFHEYFPIGRTAESRGRVYRKVSWGPLLDVFVLDMRTFRGPNTANLQTAPSAETAFLGDEQARWLVDELDRSKATWKIIAADMPIGLQIPDASPTGPVAWEAIANADDGPPKGRELELAWVLRQLKRRRVRNVVWLTADVHYCAAHHYDPARAQFADFDPFWEFVSGPVNAGTFGPNPLDATFGPEVRFQKVATHPNMAPSEGYQFFGVVDIDRRSQELTARLVDVAGTTLFTQTLAAVR